MTRTDRRRKVAASLAAALLLALVGSTAAPAGAFVLAPEFIADPNYGPAGGMVRLIGTNLGSFRHFDLGFAQDGVADKEVGKATTDAAGKLSADVEVPSDAGLGDATFFATNSVGSFDAPFYVTDSEPIGDAPGPQTKKLQECEVVVILDKLTNNLTQPVHLTSDYIIVTTFTTAGGNPVFKRVEDIFERGDQATVASIVARFIRLKSSFPIDVVVTADIRLNAFIARSGSNHDMRKVPCPTKTPVLVPITVDVFARGNIPVGQVELIYRVIVREVRDT